MIFSFFELARTRDKNGIAALNQKIGTTQVVLWNFLTKFLF